MPPRHGRRETTDRPVSMIVRRIRPVSSRIPLTITGRAPLITTDRPVSMIMRVIRPVSSRIPLTITGRAPLMIMAPVLFAIP
jgi:hypothetical protein